MEYYFFFDKDKMPLAVYLCEIQDEAMCLFRMLYKQTWAESVKAGITVMKEKDITMDWWEKIYQNYNKRTKETKKIIRQVLPLKKVEKPTTVLETSRYMRNY